MTSVSLRLSLGAVLKCPKNLKDVNSSSIASGIPIVNFVAMIILMKIMIVIVIVIIQSIVDIIVNCCYYIFASYYCYTCYYCHDGALLVVRMHLFLMFFLC